MAKPQTTKPEPTQLERIGAVSPRYQALLVKHAALTARFDEIIAEVNAGSPQTMRLSPAGDVVSITPAKLSLVDQAARQSWVAQLPKPPPPKPIVRDARAVALIGDLLDPQPPEELAPQPLPPLWPEQDRYRALGAELESMQAALALISPEIEKARRDYSKKVAELRGGDYTERVARAVDAARELGGALLELHEFVNQARLDGVERRYFRLLNLSQFSDLGENSGPLQKLIADAIELRHVGGKLPDWKMPAPLDYLT
jgi:hypothetical protein